MIQDNKKWFPYFNTFFVIRKNIFSFLSTLRTDATDTAQMSIICAKHNWTVELLSLAISNWTAK